MRPKSSKEKQTKECRNLGTGDTQKKVWVLLCRRGLQTLNLFKTKVVLRYLVEDKET